jgi:hypothetical protein
MINLLPPSYKQSLKQMYYLRLVTTSFVLFLFIVLIAGALLVPSFILSALRENSLSEKLSLLEQGESFDASKTMNATIADINKKVALFKADDSGTVISKDILSAVLAKIPSGISVTSITFGSNGTGATVTIHGVSSNRKSLESFAINLRGYNRFSTVDFPISDFVKNRDIEFNITCTFS